MSRLTPPVSDRDHILGRADAPVTLVEYGDYECPYCGMAYPIIESVRRRMGDNLRFVFRHFPLTQIHPHAQHAAEMAEAAGERGNFWPMHGTLYQNQCALEDQDLILYGGAQVGIPPEWAAPASHPRLCPAGPGAFPERGAQRGERYAHVLHQRCAPRRWVGRTLTVRRGAECRPGWLETLMWDTKKRER